MERKISIQIMAMATLGWLMVSCSQSSNEIEPIPDEPMAIGMATSLKSLSHTRAVYDDNETVGNTTNLKTTGFAVHGWKNVAGAYTQVFNNTLVKGATSTTGWEYSPLRYWDKAARGYEFVAYAPQVDTNNDGADDNVSATAPNPSASPATNAKLKFTNIPQWQDITTDDDKAAAKDYIVAQNKNTTATYMANSGVVHFDFYHLLARLNIKAYCEVNDEHSMAKYILTEIKISSKGQNSSGSEEEYKVPASTITDRSCDFELKEVVTGGTPTDNLTFDTPTWGNGTGEKAIGEVTLFTHTHEVVDGVQPIIPSSVSTSPTSICSWLVAPFDIKKGFGYNTTASGDYFGPNLTLTVTYVIRTENSGGSFTFSSPYTSTVDLTYIDEDDDDKVKPLFTGFVSHGDYTLTLNIQKGGVAVLLDVGILPWIPAETDADPRDVYNW